VVREDSADLDPWLEAALELSRRPEGEAPVAPGPAAARPRGRGTVRVAGRSLRREATAPVGGGGLATAPVMRDSSLRWRRRVGLGLLLLILGVVFLRGGRAIIDGPTAPVAQARVATAFPGAERSAFAAHFAQVYLTFSPTRPDEYLAALRGLLAPGLLEDAAVVVPSDGRAQRVSQAWVARAQSLGRDRVLITVACVVQMRGAAPSLRYLAVPVARDAAGGLVVYDYPSFAPLPRMADVGALPTPAALEGPDAAAIEALLTRFFPDYLSGRTVAPEFLTPGPSLRPISHEYVFEGLGAVGQDGPSTPTTRRLVVLVRARDKATGALYTLRYHLEVAYLERWLIDSIQG